MGERKGKESEERIVFSFLVLPPSTIPFCIIYKNEMIGSSFGLFSRIPFQTDIIQKFNHKIQLVTIDFTKTASHV